MGRRLMRIPSRSGNDTYTVPIGTIADLPELLNGLGMNGWAFMQDFGLQPESFARPLRPVPIAFCGELLQRAVTLSQCDELPLLLGSQARMANLGPLRLLIESSISVRDAVDALIRFRKIWFSGFQITLIEEPGMATMAINCSGSFPGLPEIRTCYLAAMVRHLNLILGSRFPLKQIHLSRSAPADLTPYREQFHLSPSFAQIRDAVFFDPALLDARRPPAGASELSSFLQQQLRGMETAPGGGFAEQVADLIESLLMSGRCGVEQVADALSMNRLTLYRRLQQQNTTFETLLDSRRCELAQQMLQRENLSIAEIADALGYSAATNFTRAFHRWMGVSPSAWRKRM